MLHWLAVWCSGNALVSINAVALQGGPVKVKPLTFLLVTVECIGKIQWFLAYVNYIQQQLVRCIFYANFVIINTTR